MSASEHQLADNYGALDRLLHRLAFAHPAVQRVLGDLENDLFRRQYAHATVDRPVFITGLPRAGTTLLLELLHATGEFASFTYRHMPFLLSPLLWQKLTGKSRREARQQVRAHGDGMSISVDSPEAFEEVLWLTHLRKQILSDGAQQPLDRHAVDEDFRAAFDTLIRKLVVSESAADDPSGDSRRELRYLSKNNANLIRLPVLGELFDKATVLVVFRDPATHVASLRHQHQRFLALHAGDDFSRRYMAWIGHHDFGANFRAFALPDGPGTLGADDDDEEQARYWLQYWTAAYRHALESAPPNAVFVGYEALLANGRQSLERLADTLTLDHPDTLIAAHESLRAPTSRGLDLSALSTTLADSAAEIHQALRQRSLFAD